jgi:hypothetical protein
MMRSCSTRWEWIGESSNIKIRNVVLRLVCVALLAAQALAGQAGGTAVGEKITVVGFGDSITEAATQMPDEYKRWLRILDQKLTEALPACRFSVINSGRGGNSAREAMERLDRKACSISTSVRLDLNEGRYSIDEMGLRRFS